MDDLVTWLRARLDEDERAAAVATPGPWWHNPGKMWLGSEAFERYDRSVGEEFVGYGGPSPFTGCVAATGPASNVQSMADASHIARHDPAHVLAEVEAKRRILELHEASTTPALHSDAWTIMKHVVRLLALPYADHPTSLHSG